MGCGGAQREGLRFGAQADKLILEQSKVTSSIGLIQVGERKGGEEGGKEAKKAM